MNVHDESMTSMTSILMRIADLALMLEQRYQSQQRAIDAALIAADKAIIKQEQYIDRRFDAINKRLDKMEQRFIEAMTNDRLRHDVNA
jgi:vacuolar-type H+-ATPase subunit E/Vma4